MTDQRDDWARLRPNTYAVANFDPRDVYPQWTEEPDDD